MTLETVIVMSQWVGEIENHMMSQWVCDVTIDTKQSCDQQFGSFTQDL